MPFAAVGAAVAGSVASAGIGALTSGASSAAGAAVSAVSAQQQEDDINNGLKQANQVDDNALATIGTNLSPYTTTGTTAQNQLANLTGLNGTAAQGTAFAGFQADPSYGYQVSQGIKAIDQGAASRGMLQSGGTVQAEQTLGTNLANESFENYYNRISGLATTGLGAQNTLANAGLSTAKDEAGSYTSAASSLAKINSSAASGINNSLQSGIGNLTQNALSGIGSSGGIKSVDGSSFGGGGGETTDLSPSAFGGY